MTDTESDGAIDNSFDDAERDPRDVLTDKLASYPRDIKPGDIVIDLVERRPLYIRRKQADSAAEYFATHDFDLTTYKAHPWLPIGPDDTVFECVFIPTKPADITVEPKSNRSYDYPRGRLARVPVEYLYDSDTHRYDDLQIALVASILAEAIDVDEENVDRYAALTKRVFGQDVVDAAKELAESGK